ncbi:glycosyltransferase 87 family protein [Candidatus Bathyarchaeota archaeon]|nr:glycosyltransferase 87 family protein [Candidatus Bathyarchaeota archaeon]
MNRKWLFALLVGYSVAIAVSYAFPLGAGDMEWYSFYSYLDKHEAAPYIDVREGYPPLGFLIYEPFYYIFRDNPVAFSYSFRAINGTFLVATLFTLYLIIKEQYNEKRALKLSLYYAVLPSVIIANTYSNDVIALLPAALAIYMMVNKKALPCGILLGLATLGKGFPALLLIPAFIAFADSRDRIKLIGSALGVLVFASLPFMLINPLTYMSTFTHVGSRGPWETIWAIADGYYSHGGLLHPFFDKFFYHFNLLKMYPASHYDQAIYAWNFDQMPNILTLLQVAIVIIISLAYSGRKKDAVPLCGLLYISYMLFFKGYSTQFAVSTPFYALLATATGSPLLFLVPLEISHIMQMLSWNSIFEPEFLRNEHLPMLMSAVIVRTIVFASLIAISFRGSHINFQPVINLGRRLIAYEKLLKDKWLTLAICATVVMALVSVAPLYGYINDGSGFRSFKGHINVTQSEWQSLKIDDLEEGDQVMVRLNTNTWIDAELSNSTVQVERGVRNPFHLKDSFNETMLFFRADSESPSLMLRMKHSKMPFRVTEGLEGDLDANVTTEDAKLTLKLQDAGIDGNESIFTVAYPVSARVGDNFSLHLRYRVIEGNASNVWVYVFDDTDEWLYPFAASEDFVLTSETKDLYGHANLLGDDISLVEVSVMVDDNASAILRLDEFSESCSVKFYAFPTEEVAYEVFVERDFEPSISYAAALISTVTLGALIIWYLYRRTDTPEFDERSKRKML